MKNIILLILLAASSLSSPIQNEPQRHKRGVTCPPPTNLTSIFESLNQKIDPSMYLQLGSISNLKNYLPSELNTNIVFDSEHQADNTCPSSVSDDPAAPLWSRSLCPWWYNVTQLPAGHFPSVIPQAVCKCEDCVGATLNQCTTVSTNIRVLKETGCQDGFRKYEPVIMPHHVGCTCIKKSVAQDSSCGGWGCAN